MHSIYKYIISPKGDRYENTINVAGTEVVINNDVYNHQYVSRTAIIKALPSGYSTSLKVGDEVIVHHNIFRRWYDQRGEARNSSSYIDEDTYMCGHDQIYMYRRDGGAWTGFSDSCFVSPVKEENELLGEDELKHTGVLEVANKTLKELGLNEGDVVGFTPNSEFEFVVEGQRMYRMRNRDICLKYKDTEHEKHIPSWVLSMS